MRGVGNSVGRVWAKRFLLCPCAVHRVVHALNGNGHLTNAVFHSFHNASWIIDYTNHLSKYLKVHRAISLSHAPYSPVGESDGLYGQEGPLLSYCL